MELYLNERDYVGAYVDDRIVSEREERRRIGTQSRLPKLQLVIDDCLLRGDFTYEPAITHWIASVSHRIDRSKDRSIKIPEILQQALGLASQNVILKMNDDIFAVVDGKETRIYPRES